MLFGNDRNKIRQQYLDAWRKLNNGESLEALEELIGEVVQEHPEYHAVLENEDNLDRDYTPEQGQTNPFLHMGMHITLREQVATNRPAGIREITRKLLQHYQNGHSAEHAMMEVLGEVLWDAQRSNRLPNEQLYLEKLRSLAI